jgi:hypothetical protein
VAQQLQGLAPVAGGGGQLRSRFWRQQQHRDITQLGLIPAQQEGRQALVEQARLAFFAGVVKLAHGPGAFGTCLQAHAGV